MTSFPDRLPHTWDAFLSRFGGPTEVQRVALEPLLAGKNCLLSCATAGGKTEAAFAPLVERLKRRGKSSGLAVIAVVPTRALAADLNRRLAGPLERSALRLAVKTADSPDSFSKTRPDILVTTPESLDSLLANRPRALVGLRAVVLDEIHALDNTPRGDQLRILLNRLRRLKRYAFEKGDAPDSTLQFCALSATVTAPATLAGRYFSDPVIVSVPGNRPIDAEFVSFEGESSLRALFAEAGRAGQKKMLVFCRTRAETEKWAAKFSEGTPFGEKVFVHHGSLAAAERRRVESEFLLSTAAVCFATSTLELGIDIGDVDSVVLIGPPDSLASFLQRIGRGNRRTNRTDVVCFSGSDFEEAVFSVYVRTASAGRVSIGPDSSSEYWFRPSVVVQQLCSYLKQSPIREIAIDTAHELFIETDGRPLIPRSEFEEIVDGLIRRDIVQSGTGKSLFPAEGWQKLDDERRLYSNLEGALENPVEVRDGVTGRKLGEVSFRVNPGEVFNFAGKRVVATEATARRITVKPAPSGAPNPMSFGGRGTRLSRDLVAAVAEELGLPVRRPDSLLADRRVEADENGMEVEKTILYHHSGESDGLVLGEILAESAGVELVGVTDFECVFGGNLSEGEIRVARPHVERILTRLRVRLSRRYDFGSFQTFLPDSVKLRALFTGFGVGRFVAAFDGKKIR